MSAEQAIFNAACRITEPDARRRYVEQLCGQDAELRQRIEALLRIHDEDQTFLQTPDGAAGPNGTAAEGPGTVIGPYRLVRKIGQGGMGTVFLAEQTRPVQREVALKIIAPGMDSRQVIARFEAERQALALMDHPNIAHVLDAGTTPAGRPYFVMELVKGVPITTYCDELRLTPRQRLGLFVDVCQAVQHAHQKGIIHRDLKPSNILVAVYDGKPVPKIIDFGVAKATGQKLTERTIVTQFGSLVGTPEYMSPEQADPNQLDVDTRSDVYALGVLLYELLTGTTPLRRSNAEGAGLLELLRQVREDEPPRPSARLAATERLASIAARRSLEPKKLRALVRGDLDWIVMKCLEKDRTRRYETADGLARDIARHLHDEPVEASPPSAGYRLRKYARRHKTALATAAAFAVLLVAATATSIVLASWALRERDRAEQQKRAAETNFKRSLDAVDKMLTRVGETELLYVPQMEPVRRDLLQDALRFYQEFLRERGDSRVVRAEAAGAYTRVGKIQSQLGQSDEAEAAFRQAATLLEELLAESPDDPALGNDLAGVHNNLGVLYMTDTQRWPQAVTSYRHCLTILEELERHHPNAKNRKDMAVSHLNLVNIYRMMGEYDPAVKDFDEGRALLDGLLADDPGNAEYSARLAECYNNVGLVYAAQGHTADAEAVYRKELDLYKQLRHDHPDVVTYQRGMSAAYNNLGLLYVRDRKHAKAEEAYKESLALNEATLRDHPNVVRFMLDLAGSYGNMAIHVRRSRSPKESLPWAEKSLAMYEAILKRDARFVDARVGLFDAHHSRANALYQLERDAEAAKDWRRMVEVSEGQSHITMRLYRPFALARLAEHAQATAEVETLLAEGHAEPMNLHTYAQVHAICAAAAAKDAQLPPSEREKLADRYGGRAVELLRKAQATGYFQDPGRLARLKDSDDFDSVRPRPDFKALFAELEKQVKAAP
jgi:serine/threonine protein kinase